MASDRAGSILPTDKHQPTSLFALDWLMTDDRPLTTQEFPSVTCIDALTVPQPAHHRPAMALSGYALKVFALYATSLEEVLLLDCDSMPIIDPQHAFDSPEFRCAHLMVANPALPWIFMCSAAVSTCVFIILWQSII